MGFKGVGRGHEVFYGIADFVVFLFKFGASFLDLGAGSLMLEPVGDLMLAAAVAKRTTPGTSKEVGASCRA